LIAGGAVAELDGGDDSGGDPQAPRKVDTAIPTASQRTSL
jgi:hypothetical protein